MQEKHKWHARRDAAALRLPSLRHSRCRPRGADVPPACPCFAAPPLRVRVPSGKKQKTCRPTGNRFFGTPEGTRTPNPQNRNLMRYPLRYWRLFTCQIIISANPPKVKPFFVVFQKDFLSPVPPFSLVKKSPGIFPGDLMFLSSFLRELRSMPGDGSRWGRLREPWCSGPGDRSCGTPTG